MYVLMIFFSKKVLRVMKIVVLLHPQNTERRGKKKRGDFATDL